jgi:hypothetical protein
VIVPQDHSIEVYVDNQKKDYKLTEDVDDYHLEIEYLHSTHLITISFVPKPIWIKWWFWTIIVGGIAGSACWQLQYIFRWDLNVLSKSPINIFSPPFDSFSHRFFFA